MQQYRQSCSAAGNAIYRQTTVSLVGFRTLFVSTMRISVLHEMNGGTAHVIRRWQSWQVYTSTNHVVTGACPCTRLSRHRRRLPLPIQPSINTCLIKFCLYLDAFRSNLMYRPLYRRPGPRLKRPVEKQDSVLFSDDVFRSTEPNSCRKRSRWYCYYSVCHVSICDYPDIRFAEIGRHQRRLLTA